MTRGIYLVANRRVQRESTQLVQSLRQSGCRLPIALIPYDDDLPTDPRLLREITIMPPGDFPAEGHALLKQIAELWPSSRTGPFRRLLPWWGPFDEFIYTDNDVVALADWTPFFDYLGENHFLHADTEYISAGIYAYEKPEKVAEAFGPLALDSIFTTGHFASRKCPEIIAAFSATVPWLRANPGVAWPVDGPFLHLAALIGGLRVRNLCKPPDNFASPWAGDYHNSLDVIQTVQSGRPLYQIHYSGGTPDGYAAGHDLFYADCSDAERMRRYVWAALCRWSGWHFLTHRFWPGLRRRLKREG